MRLRGLRHAQTQRPLACLVLKIHILSLEFPAYPIWTVESSNALSNASRGSFPYKTLRRPSQTPDYTLSVVAQFESEFLKCCQRQAQTLRAPQRQLRRLSPLRAARRRSASASDERARDSRFLLWNSGTCQVSDFGLSRVPTRSSARPVALSRTLFPIRNPREPRAPRLRPTLIIHTWNSQSRAWSLGAGRDGGPGRETHVVLADDLLRGQQSHAAAQGAAAPHADPPRLTGTRRASDGSICDF